MDTRHVLTICFAGVWLLASARGGDEGYLTREMPARWSFTGAEQTLPSDDSWWKRFGDTTLDSLIALGMDNNFDVAAAMHRIEASRAAVRSARSGYYPTVGVSAGYTRSRTAGDIAGSRGVSQTMSYFSLGADLSWEIDLFGRVRQNVKAAGAGYRASRADYVSAMVSLAAEIASEYISYRTLGEELRVAREHIASQERVVKITRARYEAGLVSKLDVAQAQTVLSSTEAMLPQLETSAAASANSLCILLGVYPGSLESLLSGKSAPMDYRQLVEAGVPMELLRRRADLVAAESNLSQLAARVGIARKDFLPSLTLQGSVGVAAHRAGDLFDRGSLEYSVAPTLSWTLFDGLARNAAVAQAREELMAAVSTYNQSVMTAISEVENAMTGYRNALRTLEVYERGYEQSREAFDLSIDLYTQGLTAFTNVVNAQIDWLGFANSVVAARGDALTSLVTLYKALGGGFGMDEKR